MVLGILGFVGFSSADALGREAKNPYKAIPRAIMWSALGVGVLYVFSAYTQIAILGDDLATVASPLEAISAQIGMPAWFGPVLTFGVGASFFAVVVAPLNVVGRIIYVMGKEGVVAERFGRTHERHLTPHRVLLVAGPAAIVLRRGAARDRRAPDGHRRVGRHLRHLRLHGRLRPRRDRVRRLHAPREMRNGLVWVCADGRRRRHGLRVLRERVAGAGVAAQRHPVPVPRHDDRRARLVPAPRASAAPR